MVAHAYNLSTSWRQEDQKVQSHHRLCSKFREYMRREWYLPKVPPLHSLISTQDDPLEMGRELGFVAASLALRVFLTH